MNRLGLCTLLLAAAAVCQPASAQPAAGAGAAGAGLAAAREPWPTRPFLAVDTEAHAAAGTALELTPDHTRALTVGLDGTLRVWDVATGQPLQRFFLPRATPGGARLRGLAVAPNGKRVAVAGSDFRGNMALVSLETGRIERMIHADVQALGLSWSHDGRHIAVGANLWQDTRGVRVYEAGSGREVFRDTDFEGEVHALHFRPDGAFFATGWHSGAARVKLYKRSGAGYKLAREVRPSGGEVRMDWDASYQTILAGARTRLDGETLAELPFEPDRRNLGLGVGLHRVRQGADGRFYASSFSATGSGGVVRVWTGTQRLAGYTDHKVPDTQIVDLAVTHTGEVLYLTEDGVLAMLGPDGQLGWRVEPDVAQLRLRPEALQVTEQGQVLLPVGDNKQVAFDLAHPGFVPAAQVTGNWVAPRTSATGMRVLAWQGSRVGTVNEAALPYRAPAERSLSVAVHSSEPALVFSTNLQSLSKVDAQGKVLWRRGVGATVLAVNLIESRGFVVAATSNGMLRVFRWADGASVASYYLQPAARRWVSFTNEGYYEAGTGAEEMLGWVVNAGAQSVADFLPMSRFRRQLLLPGLGRALWEAGREADAVRALVGRHKPGAASVTTAAAPGPAPAAPPAPARPGTLAPALQAPPEPSTALSSASAVRLEELPPRLEVVSPGLQASVDQRQLRIRWRAITPEGAPITGVRTLVSSGSTTTRNLVVAAAELPGGDEREVVVDLPPEDCEVRLVAENRHGASVPVLVRVRWTGAKQQGGKGNLYVLAAGISRYDNPAYNLGLAAKDARDFVGALKRQQGRLYQDVVVQELLDAAASRDQVERGFAWLKERMTPRDTAIVFFAGHGFNDGATYYFITRDTDLQRLAQTAVPFDRIRAGLVSLPGRALIFVDTCHSGNVIGSNAQARDNAAAINALASSENGLVVFASSTGAQVSLENPAWGNGAFTKAVVEGLGGAADFKKRGRVTYKGLDAYVSDRVDELTRGQQTPVTPVLQGVADFPIAEVVK